MTHTTRWRPKYIVHDTRKYQRSNRPAAVSHNQFVNKPSVPSKVVIPETSGLYVKPDIGHQSKQSSIDYANLKTNSRLNVNGASAVKAFRDIHTRNNTNEVHPNYEETTAFPTCSSLANTKKRITQRMKEEFNLERDSGNSSPTDLAVNYECVSFSVLPKVRYLKT